MRIAGIGLGYVSLPLSLQFARSGVEVLGLDIDHEKVVQLERGEKATTSTPPPPVSGGFTPACLE